MERTLELLLAIQMMLLERGLRLQYISVLAVGERAQRMLLGQLQDTFSLAGRHLRGIFHSIWPKLLCWAIFYYMLCLGLVSVVPVCVHAKPKTPTACEVDGASQKPLPPTPNSPMLQPSKIFTL